MSLKPITLWGHGGTPNPWKVAMILEELNIHYEHKFIDLADLKKEPFESINPNGRVPAIEDPNTGISLWESGAILEYLVDTYDKQHTISFAAGSKEYYESKQWLHYQMSGQGPYFGQAAWFTIYHAEKLPSAIERYISEIRRVSGVLNRWLESKKYLVGGKYSYVDAAFVTWFGVVALLWSDKIDIEKDFPHVNAWLNLIKARPAIAKVLDDKAKVRVAERK
ncbi:glutathione S-transferase nitrogen catabolite repression regulator [Penicillium cf. griseofulvum]|uniref:glutathione transferase n=1 Tax=Penicillium cf. griseofulvum TaxID=2972120 RepID=A0A9W9JCM0_9EURO|nr:glutathione S-transferase nitrogen catabolite repression regulator [Penicillium cf. griseofulvum]KAJ5445188.1 glutathione S-transferase nitrogen catabolite repression regulator [Penicillium cf. griseofulvum]